MNMNKFEECPFCNGGSTNIYSLSEETAKAKAEGGEAVGKICIGLGGTRMHFVVEHWCEKIDNINFKTLSFYGRTEQEALEMWNTGDVRVVE